MASLELTHSLVLVEFDAEDPTDRLTDFFDLDVRPMPGTYVTGLGKIRGVFTAEDAATIEAWYEGRHR